MPDCGVTVVRAGGLATIGNEIKGYAMQDEEIYYTETEARKGSKRRRLRIRESGQYHLSFGHRLRNIPQNAQLFRKDGDEMKELTLLKTRDEFVELLRGGQKHFENHDLSYIDFSNLVLDDVIFTNCLFNDVVFNHTSAQRCLFNNSILNNIEFYHTSLIFADMSNCLMENVNFVFCNMHFADLNKSKMYWCEIRHVNFVEGNLRDADVETTTFDNVTMAGAKLTNTKINWSNHALISAILSKTASSHAQRSLVASIRDMTDHCWAYWMNTPHVDSETRAWAIRQLRKAVTNDKPPEALKTTYTGKKQSQG